MDRTILAAACLMVAITLGGCARDFDLERDPLPPPAVSQLAGHKDVAIVFVHGISCHEPGYSAPFQYRFAERLGLKRSADQIRKGQAVTDFYEFQNPARHADDDPMYDLYVEKRWLVADPDMSTWVKNGGHRAQARVANGLSTLAAKDAKAQKSASSDDEVQPYTTFSDVCTDRNGKFADLPKSPMHNAGVNVRTFEGGGARYTFYEVLWSPLSEAWKIENLGYDLAALRPDQRREPNLTSLGARALANGRIKDEVLNGSIPDAVYYIGQGNHDVKTVIKAAVCLSQDNHEAPSAVADLGAEVTSRCEREAIPPFPSSSPHTLFFSESLGSRALLDALAELPTDISWSDSFYKVNRSPMLPSLMKGSFFMFANQLPMIEIGRPNYSKPPRLEPVEQTAINLVDTNTGNKAIDRCIDNGGRSYAALAETSDYTETLRAFRNGAEIDVTKGAKGRKLAIQAYLREIDDCREAVWGDAKPSREIVQETETKEEPSPRDLSLAYSTHERLSNMGPRALDMRLQLKAIEIIERASLKTAKDRAALRTRLKQDSLHVVAFSDANDLLTWEVNDRFKQFFAMVDFTNAQHRVAKPLLPFAGKAGLFVDPLEAHMGYRYSEQTMDTVMCALGEPKRSKRGCATK